MFNAQRGVAYDEFKGQWLGRQGDKTTRNSFAHYARRENREALAAKHGEDVAKNRHTMAA